MNFFKRGFIFTCLFFYFNLNATFTESNILDLIKAFLPENPVILEAGAHYGEDTVKMGTLWPKGTIHAFEPLPHSFEVLQQATRSFSNIKNHLYALNNYTGKANFYVCINGDSASSLLPPKPLIDPILFFDKEAPIEVDCITLDAWAEKNAITHIDFMWLDMEGAELLALQSGLKILPTVKVIYTEVNFQEFRKGNCFYNEIRSFLEAQGFKILWQHVWDTWDLAWQGNVLFVKEDLL